MFVASLMAVSPMNTVKIVVLSIICAICVAVLIWAIVSFYKERGSAAGETAATADKPAEEETTEEPNEGTPEEEPAPADEAPAEEPASEEEAAPDEAPEEITEEAPAEEPASADEAPEEESAADEEADDAEAAIAAGVAVNVDGAALAPFYAQIEGELSESGAALFHRCVVDNRYGRMKAADEYSDEKEFLTDFFKSSMIFKRLVNAEVYGVLYSRAAAGKSGDELGALRNKYISALAIYRKADPQLNEVYGHMLEADVRHHLDKKKETGVKVPSVKKLAAYYAELGEYGAAVKVCDDAIKHGLIDIHNTGYEARRDKYIALKEKSKAE